MMTPRTLCCRSHPLASLTALEVLSRFEGWSGNTAVGLGRSGILRDPLRPTPLTPSRSEVPQAHGCSCRRPLTGRRRHELDEEVLAGADDGVWEPAHATEGADDGRRLVEAVVDPDVVIGAVLGACKGGVFETEQLAPAVLAVRLPKI